jgi:hypothetical protein
MIASMALNHMQASVTSYRIQAVYLIQEGSFMNLWDRIQHAMMVHAPPNDFFGGKNIQNLFAPPSIPTR